jgi:hypothetical protein
MYTFPFRLTVFVGHGILAICAEQPNLPADRAVVWIENEMRGILTLFWHYQGGCRWSRYAQIEENFLLYAIVSLLDMEIVRRGKVWWEVLRRLRLCGWAFGSRAIRGRALRNV